MTGFGASTREVQGRRAEVELRSVNHRHLKVSLRLPSMLGALEEEIEARVRKTVRRGAVTVQVRYEEPQTAARLRIDRMAARAYAEDLARLEKELGEAPPADARRLPLVLGLPGIVREADAGQAALPAESRELVIGALDEALAALLQAREREGGHLKKLLEAHAAEVKALVGLARERASRIPPELREKLTQRVRRLMQDVDPSATVSEPDLLREICLLADRLDVTEELGRLEGHLEALGGILEEGDEVGRRLEFLLQELNRETNTIGSKANDSELARTVVELKCEIERIREQVQNLE